MELAVGFEESLLAHPVARRVPGGTKGIQFSQPSGIDFQYGQANGMRLEQSAQLKHLAYVANGDGRDLIPTPGEGDRETLLGNAHQSGTDGGFAKSISQRELRLANLGARLNRAPHDITSYTRVCEINKTIGRRWCQRRTGHGTPSDISPSGR